MDVSLLLLTLVLYVAATAAFVGHLLALRENLRRAAFVLLGLAFATDTLAIAVRSLQDGNLAVTTLHEALAVLAWLIVGAYLLLQYRSPHQLAALGAFVAPLAFLFTFSAYLVYSGDHDLPERLRSAWLPAHIAPVVLGYAILAVAFCLSLAYLLQENQLKSKRRGGLFRRLPSLETLDQLNHRFVTWGFSLFTIGILTGAMLAKTVWGEFWSWEPVEVWSAVTWTLYAFLLQSRAAGWRGRKAATLTIVGFAALLVTFFSVTLVFPGRHGGRFG
jgi:cytochrome c-type biogenesis protein CcsB